MSEKEVTRRNFVRASVKGMAFLPLSAYVDPPIRGTIATLSIVCVGGHPDDPETGCGGTLAKFVKAGHKVTIIYLTNGDAGIPGKSHSEAAAIRTAEAKQACEILGAKPVFAGQVDGASVVTNEWYGKIRKLIEDEKPDMLFTHWPIDSHKDHLAASIMTQRAYIDMGGKFPLYFYEVCTGRQTRNFHPTDYVDISDTQAQKRRAVFCHKSQGFVSLEFYQRDHGMMEDFRGMSIGTKAAEGFVRFANEGKSIL
jgi:LmbE family N-acetylglucosaminyl deacetylase